MILAFDLQALIFSLLAITVFLSGEESKSIGAAAVSLYSAILYLSHLSLGLYESRLRDSIRGVLRRLVVSASLTLIATEILVYAFGLSFPLTLWLPVIVLQISMQCAFRYWLFFHRGVAVSRKKILVIGCGRRAEFIPTRMRRAKDRVNISELCFIDTKKNKSDIFRHEKTLQEPESWVSFLEHYLPDVIVLAQDKDETIPVMALMPLKMKGVDIVELEDFVEAEINQIALEEIKPDWLLANAGFKQDVRGTSIWNQILNKSLAAFMLLLTLPIMAITAFAIYLDDGKKNQSGVLYRQIRVGKDGKLFEILKFRSMGVNAEKNGAQWAVSDDPRVTRIGGFLRKYRLDELPQLINVLKGEMCFVGPRPERPEFMDELTKKHPYFPLRHCVTPGLTGWAQLKYPYGASEKDSFEKLKFDLYYIKHRSVLLDIFILIRTVEIVAFGRGR